MTSTINYEVYIQAKTQGMKTLSKKIIFKFNANEAPTFSSTTLENFIVKVSEEEQLLNVYSQKIDYYFS